AAQVRVFRHAAERVLLVDRGAAVGVGHGLDPATTDPMNSGRLMRPEFRTRLNASYLLQIHPIS
ncbi:hypothetical protein QCE81_32620, partial [Caballeronia sp. LZ002]|uniref:hypothetical protein n=1 Tax=Caballeronia sp. LZ002 TaxID=3038558 RepID=UPI002857024A